MMRWVIVRQLVLRRCRICPMSLSASRHYHHCVVSLMRCVRDMTTSVYLHLVSRLLMLIVPAMPALPTVRVVHRYPHERSALAARAIVDTCVPTRIVGSANNGNTTVIVVVVVD